MMVHNKRLSPELAQHLCDVCGEADRGRHVQLEIRSLSARDGAAPAIARGSRLALGAHHLPDVVARRGGKLSCPAPRPTD